MIMNNGEERKQVILKSWRKLATILSTHSNLHYYFVGGLGVRMRAASLYSRDIALEDLRNHGDIDLIIFDENFIPFLEVFQDQGYDIWHTPPVGLSTDAGGEFHSVSMCDRETGIDIGLFRASKHDHGRLITTNYRKVFHPLQSFDDTPIQVGNLKLKTMTIEWLYFMSIFQTGEKKQDGQLIFGGVDFHRFHDLQLNHYETSSNPYDYYRSVDEYDFILKKANVLNL
ncbi:MAG: hypothetical protein PHH70_04650 [Candidatus Gracilibacteria bacterium]|nr:hypothetical protein [Candidatus Gracilibacteria bacterium]